MISDESGPLALSVALQHFDEVPVRVFQQDRFSELAEPVIRLEFIPSLSRGEPLPDATGPERVFDNLVNTSKTQASGGNSRALYPRQELCDCPGLGQRLHRRVFNGALFQGLMGP